MGDITENAVAENIALRRKLQSKAEALLILTQELEQCRTERDQYKLIVNESAFKSGLHSSDNCENWYVSYPMVNSSSALMKEVKEQNKTLRIEVGLLKQRLNDAEGDIKVLRSGSHSRSGTGKGKETNTVLTTHQREELVEQLEGLNMRCEHLKNDLQTVLDEKEEIIVERDAYRCKVHRLNHEINAFLKVNPNKLIDIDGLILENKYLHERLECIMEEKGLTSQSLSKYKSMLDSKRDKSCVKWGTICTSGKIFTFKQVQQLLEKVRVGNFSSSDTTLSDLRNLCLALLESVQDKSLLITHLKKTNKALFRRIADLEKRLEDTGTKSVAVNPSRLLLDGYAGGQVDKDGIVDEVPVRDNEEENKSITSNCLDEENCDSIHSDTQDEPAVDEASGSESHQSLPADLQKLVQEALKDLENDPKSKEHTT